MKLLELNLIAFGPFTNCQLDLSAGCQGLHMIYGPNEAGKSSSLRAITDLLYGIHVRTSDDFRHPYKNLRIGGRLRHSDGTDLTVVRRKANSKSLRCGQDQEALADDVLVPFLGDVDQSFFLNMFGINHERLRSGGQEIAQGSGRIGEMLFAAGAGVVDLQQLQLDLQTQSETLLKSTGRSGSIHNHIQDYLTHRQSVNDAMISVDAWKRSDDELRSMRQRKSELDDQLGTIRRELERLQRIQNASASIDRWKAKKEKRQTLAHARPLPGDFLTLANRYLLELKSSQQLAESAAADLDRISGQLTGLIVPESLLNAAETIEALRDRVGAIRAALADRPTVEVKRDAFEREAKEILQELNRQPDLSAIDELRLPRDKTIKIQSLGNQLERLLERLHSERKNCEKLRRETTRTEGRLSEMPQTADRTHLRATLRSVQQQGDAQAELAENTLALQSLERQIELAMRKLPWFQGTMSELEAVTVPSPASIDRFEAEFAAIAQQGKILQQQLVEDENNRDALLASMTELESLQSVPSPAELARCRQRREQGWQLLLEAWRSDDPTPARQAEFLAEFPAASDLPSAYYQAVQEADQVADALRTDADRVATKAKHQVDLEQTKQRASRRRAELDQVAAQRERLESRWRQLWETLTDAPLPPADMQDWIRRHDVILQLIKQLRDQEQQHQKLQRQIDEQSQRLRQALQSLDNLPSLAGMSVLEMSQLLDDRLGQLQADATKREQIAERLADEQAELQSLQTQYVATEAEVQRLRLEWSAEMQRLGLEDTALPEQANSRLASISSLFEKFKEADRYRTRLLHIDRDAEHFATEVQAIAARVAPELHSLPFEPAFQELLSRLEAARTTVSQRDSLIKQQQQLELKLKSAQEKAAQATGMLDEMVRQAKVTDYDELAPAAEASRALREIDQTIADLEDEILGNCAGTTLSEFIAMVDQETRAEESVAQRIEHRQQKQVELSEARDEVLGAIRTAEIELEKYDGSDRAVAENSICESIAARLEDELQSLAVYRAARALLNAGIERHREKNQGPILGRASQIFRRITLGQYAGLQAEYNDKGEPVLAGIRNAPDNVSAPVVAHPSATLWLDFEDDTVVLGGERVLVNGMSDGTCDQLYLALRLASLESWLDHHEPIPFIVDDVLMNFDDQRSIATLQILAELSRRTQVIFFTHHQHLVDLAQTHLSSEELFVTPLATP